MAASKVLGVIPARYASSRFPGKLLVPIMGESVLRRTYQSASACTGLDHLIVATDDERIARHVEAFGGKAYLTSPSCPNGTARAAEALQLYRDLQGYDIVCVIQGDEPCLSKDSLTSAIRLLQNDLEAVCATAAVPLEDEALIKNPSVVKCVMDSFQNALYFSRSPIPYFQTQKTSSCYQHVGVYCYRPDFLLQYPTLASTPLQLAEDLEQLKILENGFRIKVALLDAKALTPHVDVPEDIEKVERFLCR